MSYPFFDSDYLRAQEFIYSISNIPKKEYMTTRKRTDLFLKRMRLLLDFLGKPETASKIILVGGTSGKGSVNMLLHQILRSAGYSVGSFFSPHVSSFLERTVINGLEISPQQFWKSLRAVMLAMERMIDSKWGLPSTFEVLLASSLTCFRQAKCEYITLEVGCGGRFDATNAVSDRGISILTNVDRDHVELLGPHLTDIAWDKAGIAKKNCPLFTAEKRPGLIKIIRAEAGKMHADCIVVKREAGSENSNVQLVKRVCQYLQIDSAAVEKGINAAVLPARFEIVSQNPLVIIDGAHNEAKMKFLAERIRAEGIQRVNLVVAMAGNKEYKRVLAAIDPLVERYFVTRYSNPFRKHWDLFQAKQHIQKKLNKKAETFISPEKALAAAISSGKHKKPIVVSGSFFLCGDLRNSFRESLNQFSTTSTYFK